MLNILLFYITLLMGFVPLLIFKMGKSAHRSEVAFMAPLLWLLAFAALYEGVMTKVFGFRTDIWFRLYTLLEFLCLAYFFYRLLDPSYKRLIYGFLLLFSGIFIILLFFWNSVGHMDGDSYLTIVETLFVYTMAFLWFKDIFSTLELTSLWNSPAFYFISASILYFSGTFFLFMLSQSIQIDKQLSLSACWMLNIVLSLIHRILLIAGIWKGQQKLTQYSG